MVTAGLAPLIAAGSASAQTAACAGQTDLHAQVRSLPALVQRLSDHDQACQAQVQVLQQRLDEVPVATSASPGVPSGFVFDKAHGAAATWAALGVPIGDGFDAIPLRSQIVF